MRSRRLRARPAAARDLRARVSFLKKRRGAAFAAAYADRLTEWLERLADSGGVFGTAVEADPQFRSFGYRRQATIIAEFTDEEMAVVRIYFRGQDWSKGR